MWTIWQSACVHVRRAKPFMTNAAPWRYFYYSPCWRYVTPYHTRQSTSWISSSIMISCNKTRVILMMTTTMMMMTTTIMTIMMIILFRTVPKGVGAQRKFCSVQIMVRTSWYFFKQQKTVWFGLGIFRGHLVLNSYDLQFSFMFYLMDRFIVF